ncbi:uncharacterized protein TRAVEDRAFT_125662 [Trametes versicolor FP-101664 SS1]|uniref:uncharacterized protein n=1 Tax=Trametes versicolor (strain FP-101664) TaxID=717944 RepID=UPI0004623AD0|nr:uncharacterized protein TRAVEDRAFT_125662 [Trametes versicolor FP-101664 SS1]EIW57960.1 hypothetical protein TRAVEDRAFT_125662 [Trametes versicolor FP-101664 SS1]
MLTESLPSDRKVSFSAGCGQALQAPFEILEGSHHPQTTANIGVSLPGNTLKGPAERWQQLSMAIAVEGSACCDPFDRDDLLCHAVAHSAACARNLMLAHGLLVSFVLGVYGRTCRILRFDHTCGLVSEAFDYTRRPDLLRRFFWNFVHPCLGDTVVGCDPTVHALVNADVIWAEKQLAAMKVTKAILIPQEGRRVDVYDDTDASTRSFILLKPLSAERRLFSRATTVWLAIEDVRSRTNNDQTDTGMPSPKLVIVKEAWREIETRSEALIYQILQHANQAERFGLPKLVCGEDLGEREVALWKTGKLEYAYRERSQMRLVIDVVGRPLADFQSTKQLVRAIRDVVRGHENAWRIGVLHRDISEGNVLLVDENLASLFPFTAFLHDFDYSWFASQQEDASTSTCSVTASGDKMPNSDDRVLLGQTVGLWRSSRLTSS